MKMVEHTSDRYSGRTSCGRPLCRPDPDLVAKLNNYDGLLAALKTVFTVIGESLIDDDLDSETFRDRMVQLQDQARAAIAEAEEAP